MKEAVKEYEDFVLINDNTNQSAKCYLRYEVLYEEDIKSFLEHAKDKKILVDGCPYDYQEYFTDLAIYEKKYGYKYKEGKKYRTRYAVTIILLMPKDLQGEQQKEKRKMLIRDFIKSLSETSRLTPEESKDRKKERKELDDILNYVAFEETRGNGLYVQLIISERQYKNKPDYKKYHYTIYWNPTKKQICKKTDPAAEIKYEKGDYILDKNGNRIIDDRRFGFKIRRFSSDDFGRFLDQLKDNFIVCVKKILKNVKRGIHIIRAGADEKNKKPEYIKQKRAYYSFHFFNRRCIEEVNHTIQFVEYHINYLLAVERNKLLGTLNTANEELPVMDLAVPEIRSKIQLITNLYLKYKRIFEEGWFAGDGVSKAIKTKGVKLPELKSNLDELLKIFKQECLALDSKIFDL